MLSSDAPIPELIRQTAIYPHYATIPNPCVLLTNGNPDLFDKFPGSGADDSGERVPYQGIHPDSHDIPFDAGGRSLLLGELHRLEYSVSAERGEGGEMGLSR
jgi:hypothetical protein